MASSNGAAASFIATSLFTRSLATADQLTRRVEVGMLWVNMPAVPSAEMPFGGVKDSGYGTEGGPEAMDCYLNTRAVSILQSAGYTWKTAPPGEQPGSGLKRPDGHPVPRHLPAPLGRPVQRVAHGQGGTGSARQSPPSANTKTSGGRSRWRRMKDQSSLPCSQVRTSSSAIQPHGGSGSARRP